MKDISKNAEARTVHLDDLASLVGVELAPSPWVKIVQEDIDRFAELTGDFEWIHVDVERAEQEFGGTIAHGYHILSLIPAMSEASLNIEGVRNGLNYGLDKLRFTNMVRAGARLRLHRKLLSVEPERGGWRTRHLFTMEIEGSDKPALVAEGVFLIFGNA